MREDLSAGVKEFVRDKSPVTPLPIQSKICAVALIATPFVNLITGAAFAVLLCTTKPSSLTKFVWHSPLPTSLAPVQLSDS